MSNEKRSYELKARAESQRQTRERIAAAAAELHEEVGVARTTVADIARRAGVQRLTVYNHFPGLAELLPACSAHYLQRHPRPDLGAVFAIEDPTARVRAALAALYRWYRTTEPMTARVQGERDSVPELEGHMAQTVDRQLAELAAGLAAGFDLRGRRADRARALIRIALEFWTWRRLDRQGLDDDAAAELMTDALCAVAQVPGRPTGQ
ncbi:MAG: TetR/AcrR family transcriptional regulator [Actinomycetota bacterium]|nr:TetR/AcrR family transcriptional regulator [Actinomycetota bacterium]